MPLVCPQCQQNYDQHNICPLCNVVLLFQPENNAADGSAPGLTNDRPEWQQTPWGKIIVGLILAQGLGHGLRHLLMAGFVAGGDSDVWGTLWGIVLLHCVHAFSLLVGGAITGAGQRGGIIYGAILGIVNGGLTLVLSGKLDEASSWLTWAEPLMHLAVGALGGALGMLIWRPAPKIPELDVGTSPIPPVNVAPLFGKMFEGPIHMARVCIGAFVVVMGVVWSAAILDFLLRASNGTLTISSRLQAELVSLEIAALVALLGSAFAGATTYNGLKQGLCVGLGAAVIVLGVRISNTLLETLILIEMGIVLLSLVGGWFGSQLFPPVSSRRRRSVYDD